MTDAPKPEARKTGWEDWATRTTAILAVIAALSSGRWGASNLQAILEQGKVNDTWAYFQAKSMKQHDAEQIRDLARALAANEPPERAAALQTLQAHLDGEARKEEKEKIDRQNEALEYQKRRDQLVESSFWFEMSFTGLQLGVILCTIAAGAKRRAPWIIGILCGVIGVGVLVNGFVGRFKAPRGWYQSTSTQMGTNEESHTTANKDR